MPEENKPIKMQLPNKQTLAKMAHTKGSVTGDRPALSSTGNLSAAVGQPLSVYNQPFARGTTVHVPLTKASQAIGGGLGITVTQPMFFSPMHTPQNWQIASRRREVYQWSFVDTDENPCYLFNNDDFMPQRISDVFDTCNNSLVYDVVYEDENSRILDISQSGLNFSDGHGNPTSVAKISRRKLSSPINSVMVMGLPHAISVTSNHNCRVIKRSDIKCKRERWHNKNCVPGCCSEEKDYPISTVEAQDVQVGDYMVFPIDRSCNDLYLDNDECFFIGYLAGDGHVCDGNNASNYHGAGIVSGLIDKDYVFEKARRVFAKFGLSPNEEECESDKIVAIRSGNREFVNYCKQFVVGSGPRKRFTAEVLKMRPDQQLKVLAGFIQADGDYNKDHNDTLNITTYSVHFGYQLLSMFYRCNILARLNRQPLSSSSGTFSTESKYRYILSVPSNEIYKFGNDLPLKAVGYRERGRKQNKRFFWKDYVVTPVTKNDVSNFEGFVYDIEAPPTYTVCVNGLSIHQCRFYYENEPKVAAAIDFYSQFPINGFKLECKKKSILKYFERLIEKLDLLKWLRLISHERFMLGDVFVFLDVECPKCHGTGIDPDDEEEVCLHPEGSFKRIIILNPDWIEVYTTVLADEPEIVLMPDDELKKIVQTRQPKPIYDRLPEAVKALVAAGRPIRLSNSVTSHLKHNGAPYGTYGDSILRRLFTILAYKTKLMTANWIIAERLILPVRVVKVGEKERPASEEDIADVTQQLAAVANDPNLTIVTHHAFDYEWHGSTGKIHNITAEMELIGKEILDGLMLNQALLNGEMSSYSSAQIGAETMIMRLDTWRAELKDWVEKHIFLPIAKMRGFIDEEESEEIGETVYLFPTLKWEDMRLRDNTNEKQMAIQLNQNGKISDRTLLEKYFDLNYDQEVEQMREEQVMAMQNGQLPGGGAGGMGAPGGGMGGGMGGGGPPMGGDPMGGGMPGGMGAPGGGAPMGGAPGGAPGGMGGAPMGGGMGASAGGPQPGKVYKKGKAPKANEPSPEELAASQPTPIRLTKPEAKLWRLLQGMRLPFGVFAQFKQQIPGNPQPFAMDFAIPDLRLDLEADGEQWHNDPESKKSDNERDMKLANLGWTVIRFPETALNENLQQVQKVLEESIAEASKASKEMRKKSSVQGDAVFKVVYHDEKIGLSDSVEAGYTSIIRTGLTSE